MATVITGQDKISLFQMKSQLSALKMEIMGIRFRGGSICAHIKRTYGITARKKQDVADQFEKMVKETEELAGY